MLTDYFEESIELHQKIFKESGFFEQLSKIINEIEKVFKSGHKILIAGNGGSAADSQHLAAELVCTFKMNRQGLPAISLTTDSSVITAWSNDFDYESVFSRQVQALGQKGDLFLAISTSGNSKNLILAAKQSQKQGLRVVSLLGKSGGKLKKLSDLTMIIPSQNTPRIQEIQTLLIHIISEEIEKKLNK